MKLALKKTQVEVIVLKVIFRIYILNIQNYKLGYFYTQNCHINSAFIQNLLSHDCTFILACPMLRVIIKACVPSWETCSYRL